MVGAEREVVAVLLEAVVVVWYHVFVLIGVNTFVRSLISDELSKVESSQVKNNKN